MKYNIITYIILYYIILYYIILFDIYYIYNIIIQYYCLTDLKLSSGNSFSLDESKIAVWKRVKESEEIPVTSIFYFSTVFSTLKIIKL